MEQFSKKDLLSLINKTKEKLKSSSDVLKDMFKEYDVDLDELDYIPMCFADLDVSARTEHGCIYFNYKLLDDPAQLDHYMIHEITHVLQQTTGNRPTSGSTDDTYLDNKEEIEGFQNQTEHLKETKGPEVADKYIDKVLDHHDVDSEKEREKRKKQLLERKSKFLYVLAK